MYKIKVGISPKKLENLIRKDVKKIIDDATKIRIPILVSSILTDHIRNILEQTSVWHDFQNRGPLWKRLGGGDLASKLSSIIEHWANSVEIAEEGVISIQGEYGYQIVLTAIKADYSDVLSLDTATFQSTTTREGPRKGEKHEIEWLRWLLTKGQEYVVKQYVFTEKLESKESRGGGLMIPKRSAAGWRVPKEYSGTMDDNFVTKALDQYMDKVVTDIFNTAKRIV
jgi:hypothetical protein